jgi:MFS family permease
LEVRNYRFYFVGQIVSVSGTWMQGVAQAWLVTTLTNSSIALGATAALQFTPMLLAGAWGGVVADRFDKRRILIATQTASALLALTLGIVVAFNVEQLWVVYLMAFLLGLVNLVDMPTRQAFVMEIVGPDNIANAVSLNSVVVNAGRIVGPALAGVLIWKVNIAVCFFVNAASYLAVIGALLAMRRSELQRAARVPREPGQLREGLRYASADPELRRPLILVGVVGLLAFNFSIFLTLMARHELHSNAAGFGALTAMLGVGAVIGGLLVAARGRTDARLMAWAGVATGFTLVIAAVMPTLPLELVAVVPLGMAMIAFIASANSLLQLRSLPQMRGRVMALYGVLFLGTTPVGALLVSAIAQALNVRDAMAIAGGITLLAGLGVLRAVLRAGRADVLEIGAPHTPDTVRTPARAS